MQHVVETLFVIGILANLIKGADLILRPHQQKWMQDKFESLVLWADYTKPFDWYVKRKGVEKVYESEYVWLYPLVGTIFLTILTFVAAWPWWAYLFGLLVLIFSVIQVKQAPSRYTILRISPQLERWTLGWLFGGKTLTQNIVRHLIIVIFGIVATFVGYSSYRSIISGFIKSPRYSPPLIQSFIVSILMMITLMGALSLSIFIWALLFLIMELILKLIRGLVWRMVEYSKGAFAAIILIATIALGLTELFLKFQK